MKTGKANASSGRIMVTCAADYFGPIGPEFDPERSQGVAVGEIWEDRLACRQWGAHLPHVAGIAGQSHKGAQSVALSGGYEDDEDHGALQQLQAPSAPHWWLRLPRHSLVQASGSSTPALEAAT